MSMRFTYKMVLGTCGLILGGAALAIARNQVPLRVVPNIDLARYAGIWYEIARLPNRFERICQSDVTARYTLLPDGRISVINSCRRLDGSVTVAEGVARVVGKGRPNSVLKVRFAPAFLSFIPQVWGDYQVMALSPDYQYALVGDPQRKYLWILSRSPELDERAYNALIAEAKDQGFPVNQLVKTSQSH